MTKIKIQLNSPAISNRQIEPWAVAQEFLSM
jgi:hypothetical protein